MEERLKELGDPSGKQTSEYWNEWFHVVCGEDHQPFEWYCSVKEVARVLQWHTQPRNTTTITTTTTTTTTTLEDDDNNNNNKTKLRMIHPGSGNSLVPVKLRDEFDFPHYHTVVDISNVALEEMKTIHDKSSSMSNKQSMDNNNNDNDRREHEIEYMWGNVLEPPLALDDDMFDVWVDKGLVDALFEDTSEPYKIQSQTLFSEAFRLLKHDTGLIMVVTMAEKHSLQLIVLNFWEKIKDESASLHVWELEPVSGDMRPFGFVLQFHTRVDDEEVNSSMPDLYWHASSQNDAVPSEIRLDEKNFEALLAEASRQCETSRLHFKEARLKQLQDQTLATIEIKPWDAETDMEQLKEIIVSRSWIVLSNDGVERTIKPQWRMSESKVVPIGYGVCKLVLQCVLNTDDVDDLVDVISEWDGDSIIEDGVQSVDVDWSQTHQIASLPNITFPK